MREIAENTRQKQTVDKQGKKKQFNESSIFKRPTYQTHTGRLDGVATK